MDGKRGNTESGVVGDYDFVIILRWIKDLVVGRVA
jgi:hypothetical protein